jgi:selenide,water dikinase
MSSKPRFLDLAAHGGCSKKVGGKDLQRLLSDSEDSETDNPFSEIKGWMDFGLYYRVDHADEALISNVDIVLPMVPDPADFGEIVVAHVLSDIYTSGAKPLFGLNILGVQHSIDLGSNGNEIKRMLASAAKKLHSAGARLVGGHSIGNQYDLYYGLAVFGVIDKESLITNRGAKIGDALVLTKPLGTSIASKLWKRNRHLDEDFQDVLEGMKQLNDMAAEEMLQFQAHACTDITGFGLLGHTHNLLRASEAACVINMESLPIYESVQDFGGVEYETMIFDKNKEYVIEYVDSNDVELTPLLDDVIYDAQVSGGLLVSLPTGKASQYVERLRDREVTASIIGRIVEGQVGHIKLLP